MTTKSPSTPVLTFDRANGIQHGAHWAKHRAARNELASLADHAATIGVDAIVQEFGPAFFAGYQIQDQDEYQDAVDRLRDDFWENLGLEDFPEPSEEFLVGFVEGAVEMWPEAVPA